MRPNLMYIFLLSISLYTMHVTVCTKRWLEGTDGEELVIVPKFYKLAVSFDSSKGS